MNTPAKGAMRPATAIGLFEALKPYQPLVEHGNLTFTTNPPDELDPLLRVLHTGIRSLITGKIWYGEKSCKPGVVVLNPGVVIPARITLLCVSGDQKWDRIPADARIDLPQLFESVAAKAAA